MVLDSSKILRVRGKVFSGSGEGAKFIELPWVRMQLAEKLGFIPYPGTLNVRLTEGSISLRELVKNAKSMEISPARGFYRGRCFKAYFMANLKCAIVIPEVADYPKGVIEFIAPISLRERFQLKDGDVVEIQIML